MDQTKKLRNIISNVRNDSILTKTRLKKKVMYENSINPRGTDNFTETHAHSA